MDVIFLEVVSVPLQQRFMLHGAHEDTTLLAPMITDDTKNLAVIEEAEDRLIYYCMCNENAPKFGKTKVVEVMMAY